MSDIIEDELQSIYRLRIEVEKDETYYKSYKIGIRFDDFNMLLICYKWKDNLTYESNIEAIETLIDLNILKRYKKGSKIK